MQRAAIPLALGLLLGGCRTRLLDGDAAAAVDLGGADLTAPVDLARSDLRLVDLAPPDLGGHSCGAQTCNVNQGCVIPCCGGAPPQCTPAPDGGCAPPLQPCPFGGVGCYQPCTPPPPSCVDLPPACAADPGANLCACIKAHGGTDPCTPGGGDNCADNITNLPPGQIMCLCY